jgi:hypothetical protein
MHKRPNLGTLLWPNKKSVKKFEIMERKKEK